MGSTRLRVVGGLLIAREIQRAPGDPKVAAGIGHGGVPISLRCRMKQAELYGVEFR